MITAPVSYTHLDVYKRQVCVWISTIETCDHNLLQGLYCTEDAGIVSWDVALWQTVCTCVCFATALGKHATSFIMPIMQLLKEFWSTLIVEPWHKKLKQNLLSVPKCGTHDLTSPKWYLEFCLLVSPLHSLLLRSRDFMQLLCFITA